MPGFGQRVSPETREKLKAAKAGRRLSEEHKAAIGASVTRSHERRMRARYENLRAQETRRPFKMQIALSRRVYDFVVHTLPSAAAAPLTGRLWGAEVLIDETLPANAGEWRWADGRVLKVILDGLQLHPAAEGARAVAEGFARKEMS